MQPHDQPIKSARRLYNVGTKTGHLKSYRQGLEAGVCAGELLLRVLISMQAKFPNKERPEAVVYRIDVIVVIIAVDSTIHG